MLINNNCSTKLAYLLSLYIIFIIIHLTVCTTECAAAISLPNDKLSLAPVQNKSPLRVKLTIQDYPRITMSESLKIYQYESDLLTLIADRFKDNAKQLHENIFDNSKDSEFVLTLKITFINFVVGGSAWDESKMSIGVEWRLTTVQGKTKWVENIIGEAVGFTGSAFSAKANRIEDLSKAMQDVFEKSKIAMLSSTILMNDAQK